MGLRCFALIVALCGCCQAQSQDTKGPYPNMAPVDQYMMERGAEIALARSAAPATISGDAEVLVLGRHGYEVAVKGKNGFACVVERSWMSGFRDDPEFWNPKQRAPVCFNPPAVRFVLPLTMKKTELVLAGLSKAQVLDGFEAFGKKELPPLESGAMSFMMSIDAYLSDTAGHAGPHLMFYVARTEASAWGADLHGSPVMLGFEQFPGAPTPVAMFIIPVSHWSDGTSTTPHAH